MHLLYLPWYFSSKNWRILLPLFLLLMIGPSIAASTVSHVTRYWSVLSIQVWITWSSLYILSCGFAVNPFKTLRGTSSPKPITYHMLSMSANSLSSSSLIGAFLKTKISKNELWSNNHNWLISLWSFMHYLLLYCKSCQIMIMLSHSYLFEIELGFWKPSMRLADLFTPLKQNHLTLVCWEVWFILITKPQV